MARSGVLGRSGLTVCSLLFSLALSPGAGRLAYSLFLSGVPKNGTRSERDAALWKGEALPVCLLVCLPGLLTQVLTG
ncbi:hypothetical protein A4R35_17795 [Thermogemmatispora tikiterensis]|uniref:Uncharacterized protein n=1 Tax=Thermogemmatispora tikiterensis TaxID=1825093 RepID=A0A328VTF0_9CHLR|nr:hypothetical protein A4R35_17795 [Thermogemmatispora tikiterensis]